MTVEKSKPKQLLRPITTGADSAMNQSQLLAITCNSLEAREKSRVHGAIGFGFDSHWLKNWRESVKPITKRSSHLKTALNENHSLNPKVDSYQLVSYQVFVFRDKLHTPKTVVLKTLKIRLYNERGCRISQKSPPVRLRSSDTLHDRTGEATTDGHYAGLTS